MYNLKELYTSDTTLSQMIDWTPHSNELWGKIRSAPPPENRERSCFPFAFCTVPFANCTVPFAISTVLDRADGELDRTDGERDRTDGERDRADGERDRADGERKVISSRFI